MPKGPSDGKRKKRKNKSKERPENSTEETDEKNLSLEVQANAFKGEVQESKSVAVKAPYCVILPPPSTICMRTTIATQAASMSMQAPPQPSGNTLGGACCPTLAVLSRPEAFCPPITGNAPCPVFRSFSCGQQNAVAPAVNTAPQELGQPFQPQELKSQAPIIVCTPSQLSLATQIAADGQIPPPEVVSSVSKSCRKPTCPAGEQRSMPSAPPPEFQFTPTPASEFPTIEEECVPEGQGQWCRPAPCMADTTPFPEGRRCRKRYPDPRTYPNCCQDNQQDFQAPEISQMPSAPECSDNFPQSPSAAGPWRENFAPDASAASVSIPLSTSQEISHVVTIDIRVHSVQNPIPSGITINKPQYNERQMNTQGGTMQNRITFNASQCDSFQELPPSVPIMPETPPSSAGPVRTAGIVREMIEEMAAGTSPPMRDTIGASKFQTGQPNNQGTVGQPCPRRWQIVPCPSYGNTPPQLSPGKRYACSNTPSRRCSQSSTCSQGNQSTSQVQQSLGTYPNLDDRTDRSCRMRPRSGSDPGVGTTPRTLPRREPSGSSLLYALADMIPTISACLSRPRRGSSTSNFSQNGPFAITQGPEKKGRPRKPRSQSTGSRTLVSRDTEAADPIPLVSSPSEPRRKRKSMS